jgi:hypothetical protein
VTKTTMPYMVHKKKKLKKKKKKKEECNLDFTNGVYGKMSLNNFARMGCWNIDRNQIWLLIAVTRKNFHLPP